MAEHWLDILPAITLARGVPVTSSSRALATQFGDYGRGVVGLHQDTASGPMVRTVRDTGDLDGGWTAEHCFRVDLDDPQGFGYALRWLAINSDDRADDIINRLSDQWLNWWESINPADRLALARAIAEIINT